MHVNADILGNPDQANDGYFLTGSFDAKTNVIQITANGSIVAQEKERAQNGVYWRKDWDSPDTRRNLNDVTPNQRMIGAGGIVSVQIGSQNPLTILFEKTGGPSIGRMASATGLCDRHPVETMVSEIAEETGILLVDRDNKKLTFLCVTPDETLAPVFNREALIDRLLAKKQAQVGIIREQLEDEMKSWAIDIEHRDVGLNPEMETYTEEVTIEMPDGNEQKIKAIVADSDKTANVNLMMPVLLELPEGTEYIALDPEKFKRPVSEFTLKEMTTEGFIEHKSSVPMRPFLQKARADLAHQM
jgi:hypothetical protein